MGYGDSQMIRIDAVWLAVTPMDMRAGTDTALADVAKNHVPAFRGLFPDYK